MGFGLIFLGWSTLLFFKILPPVNILGCLLMLKGLEKLSGYNKDFERAKNADAVLLAYYIFYCVMWILDIFGIYDFAKNTNLLYLDAIVYRTVLILFSVFLYRALGNISREVEFDKGIKRERNCTSLVIVFVIFLGIQLAVSFANIGKYESYLNLSLVVFEVIWLIYSAAYIYSCYMMIATQQIIDDENRKMREYDEKYSFRTQKNKGLKK